MTNKTCWLDIIEYDEAEASLKKTYDNVKSPNGQLDNLYKAFSLRAHTIKPADDLYRAALHNANNTLPKWFSEFIGTYVAILAGCEYAQAHHGHNFMHLFGDKEKAQTILDNLTCGNLAACGNPKEVAALRYARKLCDEPDAISEEDLIRMTDIGWTHGDVLEVIQVVAMFSYFTRVINATGISLGNETIGLY